jgi:hypothetical protein
MKRTFLHASYFEALKVADDAMLRDQHTHHIHTYLIHTYIHTYVHIHDFPWP